MGLPPTAVEAGAATMPLSTPTQGAWDPVGAVQPPGVVRGGVSLAYSTLAAAETVPGRGPITQCRLLLGGKQT